MKKFKLLFVFALIISCFFFMTDIKTSAQEVEEEETISFDDEGVTVSEPMTFDEMVAEISKNNGVSEEQVREQLKPNITQSGAELRATRYRTLSKQLNVTASYKPSIVFYVETSEGGGMAGIVAVHNVSMNRVYNGVSKGFAGNVYTKLENANRIYYDISGDFFNNSSSTVGFDVNIPIGGGATVGFSASNTSSHYAGFYTNDRLRWPY